jgi:hypothetical protein
MMEELHNETPGALQSSESTFVPDPAISSQAIPQKLDQLWQEVSTNRGSDKSAV